MKNITLVLGVNDIEITVKPKPKKNGKPSKAKTRTYRLGDIAEWSEYGTETSPPRPANRMGMERAVVNNKKMIQGYLKNMVMIGLMNDRAAAKKLTRERKIKLFTQIGRSARMEARDVIKNKETAPNAPATIAKKGFDYPLRVTGTYEKNIAYEVKS